MVGLLYMASIILLARVSLYDVECLAFVVVNGDGDTAEGNGVLTIGGGGTDLADSVTIFVMMIGVGLVVALGSDAEIFLAGFSCILGTFAGF